MAEPAADTELEDLLRAAAGGDRTAFGRLYDLAAPHLFAIALRILRRRDRAEEVLQDAFVSIWRRASDWSPERQGPVWRTGPHYGAIFGNWQSEIFYRNVNESSIVSSYKFGINIVFYLLNRYKDKLHALPI